MVCDVRRYLRRKLWYVDDAEAGVLFYGIYLWVITGNGVRYGKESLVSSYVTSLIGFSAVIYLNNFWHDHLRIAIGLWLTLLCVPLYILKLRGQLNDAIEKAQAASRAKSDFLSSMATRCAPHSMV